MLLVLKIKFVNAEWHLNKNTMKRFHLYCIRKELGPNAKKLYKAGCWFPFHPIYMTLLISQPLFSASFLCCKMRVMLNSYSKKREESFYKIRVIKYSVFLVLIMTLNNKLIV